ncbi:MAG: hypothetical protein NWE81_02795 [Candidatus Bathyarchaeota archaeon]|nr:hypothetical protein [Candidatus Bathyarchaeota archaeon]
MKVSIKRFAENSLAVDALLRLHHLTGRMKYLDSAKKTLNHLAQRYEELGLNAAAYGLAVELYRFPLQIQIVGQKHAAKQFLRESLRAYNPLKIIELLDPETDLERLRSLNYQTSDGPIAYVCTKGVCTTAKDPKEIPLKVSIPRQGF